jgi:hypothetical protein
MKEKTILVCIVTLLILLSTSNVIAQGPPSPPCVFYGYVNVGGKPAQDGLNVTAVIRGTTLKWTTETRSGTYGWPAKGSSSFEIPSDDPETPEKDGGVTGNRIEFYVNGTNTNQTATFESGIAKKSDLSIPEIPGQPESTPNATLTVSLDCSTTYIGFKVEIDGNLTYNGTAISGAPILLSYSVTDGNSWNDITRVNTTSDGKYSAVWMPSATVNYLVKAAWAGNSTHLGASTIVNLAVTAFKEQNVFSVTSNSTVSQFSFNSTSRELSFTVSGPSGTTGYVNVYIAKSLIGDISTLKVYLDGNQIDYTAVSTNASWLLHFTYQHSTHRVIVSLGSPANSYPLYTVVIVIAIGTGAAAVFWIHRKGYRIKVLKKP